MKQSVVMVGSAAFVMLFIAALLIFGPVFVIWSLNTLFPVLAIPYTLETWCAVVIMAWFMKMRVSVRGN